MFNARKIVLGIAIAALAVGITGNLADEANAQWGIYTGSPYYTPAYHAPSAHYDRVYQTTPHWTPGRGSRAHTRSAVVPHYTPGHFDTLHNGHLHLNRRHHLTH